jgi:hypothetical protein
MFLSPGDYETFFQVLKDGSYQVWQSGLMNELKTAINPALLRLSFAARARGYYIPESEKPLQAIIIMSVKYQPYLTDSALTPLCNGPKLISERVQKFVPFCEIIIFNNMYSSIYMYYKLNICVFEKNVRKSVQKSSGLLRVAEGMVPTPPPLSQGVYPPTSDSFFQHQSTAS